MQISETRLDICSDALQGRSLPLTVNQSAEYSRSWSATCCRIYCRGLTLSVLINSPMFDLPKYLLRVIIVTSCAHLIRSKDQKYSGDASLAKNVNFSTHPFLFCENFSTHPTIPYHDLVCKYSSGPCRCPSVGDAFSPVPTRRHVHLHLVYASAGQACQYASMTRHKARIKVNTSHGTEGMGCLRSYYKQHVAGSSRGPGDVPRIYENTYEGAAMGTARHPAAMR